MTLSNYRPIALTSQISKCFKSIMRMEILSHMEKIGIISAEQQGSIVERNTVNQLLDEDNVEICYLDFAKAYDKLDHRIMITKLSKMGIKGKNLGWITNWLTPRKTKGQDQLFTILME